MMYTETTHGKKERENNPPQRERERVPLLCYVHSLFLMCAYKYREKSLFLRSFVFLTLFSSRGDFCFFFRSSSFFHLSFAFKNLWFFSFLSFHTQQTELFFHILLKNKPATTRRKTKRTSANIYIFERKEIIKFFLLAHVRCDLILKRDFLKKTQQERSEKKQKRGARAERHRLRTSHALVPCARREEKKK